MMAGLAVEEPGAAVDEVAPGDSLELRSGRHVDRCGGDLILDALVQRQE